MKKILIVDDDDFIRMVMARTLISAGYDIEESHNGANAIEKMAKHRYDVVITDIVMPLQSGLSVAEHIRKNDLSIPVLLVSSHSQADIADDDAPEKHFATELLHKPFKKDELLEAVRRLSVLKASH